MSSTPQSQARWALAGKIGAAIITVLGALGSGVVVHDWLFKGPDVEVRVSATDFHAPPLWTLDQQEERDPVLRQLKEDSSLHTTVDPDAALREHERKQWMSFAADNYSQFASFYELRVSNEGGTAAEDIAVHVDTFYAAPRVVEISGTSMPTQVLRFSDPIRVGALSPGESATVRIWGKDPPVAASAKSLRVTHKAGAGSIVFLRETDGWWRTAGRTLWGLSTGLLMVLVVLAVSFLAVGAIGSIVSRLVDKASKKSSPEDKS